MRQSTRFRITLPILLCLAIGWWLTRNGTGPKPSTATSATGPAGSFGQAPIAMAEREGPESLALASKHGTRSSPTSAAEVAADDTFEPPKPLDGGDPSVTQSKVRALVPAGHSMIVGGHALPDGKREFAAITPTWMPDSKLIAIEVDLLQLDMASVAAAGLGTLVTGDRKTRQHAEVWTPEEVARTMAAMQGEALQARPRVITTPGTAGRITVGNAAARFELELQATEAAEGGFELSSELKRSE